MTTFKTMPTKVGLYKVRCEESDHEWSHVAITRNEKNLAAPLMVHDSDLGRYDLETYHHNLTDIEWQFVC